MKPRSKLIIPAAIAGLIIGIIVSLNCKPYVYRVTSGYSHQSFFVSFAAEPSEVELLDAVIYHDPLIQDKAGIAQAWRRAEAEGSHLRIKLSKSSSVLISPYSSDSNPDYIFPPDHVFPAGLKVSGIWLTQPSTRTRFSPALVRIAYFIISFTGTSLVVLFLLNRMPKRRTANSPPPKSEPPPRTDNNAKPDPFTVLGISRNATFEDIKRAYRTKMREYHPDKVANLGVELRELAEHKAKQINEAFEILCKKHTTA